MTRWIKDMLPFVGFGSVLLLGILLGGCASGRSASGTSVDFSNIENVAVVGVFGDIKGQTARNQIADYFGLAAR